VYLKRLELHGFKTFADRTELEFTPGITAVVGPNGSGKSNVFDAIRWALGETSFRSLRSGRMDDIIFGGSELRRAMGQAEVSLTINNDSGVLPIDYTEVTVMRRANRGGEGEYFLNDTVCRLRDIQMLFLGTGLGGRSYSLIGQGQVDSVLNAGPEERRQLLEEAAGLARYKRRRREAERRLGYGATNLLRISDILAELTAQLEQLREQAEAAAAYQAHTNEIRALELALQVDDARRIIAGLKRIATQTDTVRQQLQSAASSASEVGTQIDRDRARAVQVARLWEEAQRTLLQVVEDLSGRESTMQVLQERLRATTGQRERLAQDLQRLQSQLAQADEALGGRPAAMISWNRCVSPKTPTLPRSTRTVRPTTGWARCETSWLIWPPRGPGLSTNWPAWMRGWLHWSISSGGSTRKMPCWRRPPGNYRPQRERARRRWQASGKSRRRSRRVWHSFGPSAQK